MKKISLGITAFMFILAVIAPITQVQSFSVLNGLSGNDSSAWHSISWGYNSSTGRAYTTHTQKYHSAGAYVNVMGRSAQDVREPGQMAAARLLASSSESRTHAVW